MKGTGTTVIEMGPGIEMAIEMAIGIEMVTGIGGIGVEIEVEIEVEIAREAGGEEAAAEITEKHKHKHPGVMIEKGIQNRTIDAQQQSQQMNDQGIVPGQGQGQDPVPGQGTELGAGEAVAMVMEAIIGEVDAVGVEISTVTIIVTKLAKIQTLTITLVCVMTITMMVTSIIRIERLWRIGWNIQTLIMKEMKVSKVM